jgi:hypothetical protein
MSEMVTFYTTDVAALMTLSVERLEARLKIMRGYDNPPPLRYRVALKTAIETKKEAGR